MKNFESYAVQSIQLVPCLSNKFFANIINCFSVWDFLCVQDIARQIRPKTIRAKFGVNPIQNAVHCTDLEEDCTLEVEYFFKILLR